MNKTRIKFTLSLISAVITILINGDEDIDRGVSAWVFPVMLVCGGLVIIADWHIRPQEYSTAASSKCEFFCFNSGRGGLVAVVVVMVVAMVVAVSRPTIGGVHFGATLLTLASYPNTLTDATSAVFLFLVPDTCYVEQAVCLLSGTRKGPVWPRGGYPLS